MLFFVLNVSEINVLGCISHLQVNNRVQGAIRCLLQLESCKSGATRAAGWTGCGSVVCPAEGSREKLACYFFSVLFSLSVKEKFQKLHQGLSSELRWCVCVDSGVSRETLTRRSLSFPNHPKTRKVEPGSDGGYQQSMDSLFSQGVGRAHCSDLPERHIP